MPAHGRIPASGQERSAVGTTPGEVRRNLRRFDHPERLATGRLPGRRISTLPVVRRTTRGGRFARRHGLDGRARSNLEGRWIHLSEGDPWRGPSPAGQRRRRRKEAMTSRPDLSRDIEAVAPGVIALRRALHQHPELAFSEVWTATTLAERMRSLGLVVEDGIGGTGVLAVLEGARLGRTLLLRADMDGLPLEETTGREYASTLPDRNHACGHD